MANGYSISDKYQQSTKDVYLLLQAYFQQIFFNVERNPCKNFTVVKFYFFTRFDAKNFK